MQISVFRSLPSGPEEEIRWPGVQSIDAKLDTSQLTALRVVLDEEKSNVTHQAYSSYLEKCRPGAVDMRQYEMEGAGQSKRFLIARLLLREWAKSLHDDRLSVVLSDEPRPKSRIRTYKGLIPAHCKESLTAFAQLELEISPPSSVLVNCIDLSSRTRPDCLVLLGDTFRSFGIFDWPQPPVGDSFFPRLGSCYVDADGLWRWDAARLLAAVCSVSSSLVFLQGVANETRLQLIAYLPTNQIEAHLEIATERFGAKT